MPSTPSPTLCLGAVCPLDGATAPTPLTLPAQHLTTHVVVTGMTGSGKTGLLTVLVEEALSARVPVLMIDVKGDLANLLLAFSSFAPSHFVPFLDRSAPDASSTAETLAAERARNLAQWDITEPTLAAFHANTSLRVITPGTTAGEPLHVLSSLERRSPRWDTDPEAARSGLCAAISLVLRLIDRNPDPASSRDHVFLSLLAEHRLRAGRDADLGSLLADLEAPPFADVGAMSVDDYLPKPERRALAAALNTLLASPSFASWRSGASIDVGEWLTPREGKTPAVIVSVAHLDDDERALVLGVLLEEVLAWVRGLPGASALRALVVFDEVYGFLPPHPANPPTKRPLVALMKQARAFGVGVAVATQNPMDLDYRALSNAGLWFIGRLQTDADRARVVEGLGEAGHGRRGHPSELGAVVKQLSARWFVMRDAHAGEGAVLMQPRYAMSWLKGPMTRSELRSAVRSEEERVSVARAASGHAGASGVAGAEAGEGVAEPAA